MLEITTMSADQLDDVIALFNRGVEHHRWSARLDRDVWHRTIGRRRGYDPEMILVAYEEGAPRGYVHLSHAPLADRSGPDAAIGSIEALFFAPTRLDVGLALLAAARDKHRRAGARTILGWSSYSWYPLYRGLHVGLEPMALESDAHVVAAFRAAGYRQVQHNVVMVADPVVAPAEPRSSVPIEVSVERWAPANVWDAGSWVGLEPFRSVATIHGAEAGHCVYSLLPSLGASHGATVGGIGELGTVESWRRRGVAGVLVSRAVHHLRDLGMTRLVLITQHDNLGAQATYQRVGMGVEASTLGFELSLV